MRIKKIAATIIVLASFSATVLGCTSGQFSNADSAVPAAQRIVYPMSAAQADGVLARAMATTFPGSVLTPIQTPGRGYAATVRFALDSHRISGFAVPAQGVKEGNVLDGYAFTVTHAGSMPTTGETRAVMLFDAINREASLVSAAIPAKAN